jgi:SAM-dependent methyltransferase
MSSIGDFFIPFFIFFKVKWFLFKERREVLRRFSTFSPVEEALNRAYRFHNPFRICKEYLRQRGEKCLDAYGETPLPVLAKIIQECALNSDDVLLELGCGRGRGAMFISHLVGCRVIGIDWVPFFIDHAQKITASIKPSLRVTFRCTQMQMTDFSEATAIFLYGTCLSDALIHTLIAQFERLPPQVKIITVSYPLSDYSPRFHILKQFSALFPWGRAEIFVNLIKEGLSSPLAEEHRRDRGRDS